MASPIQSFLASTGLNAAHREEGVIKLLDVPCTPEGLHHCQRADCVASGLLTFRGDAVEPDSGRKFFIGYPCDLQPGEPMTLILNLHGGGSVGNWQRHYSPTVDYKERYRLVIITPTAASMRAFNPEGRRYGSGSLRRTTPSCGR